MPSTATELQITAITAISSALASGTEQTLVIDFAYPDDAVHAPAIEIRFRIKSPPSDWAVGAAVVRPYVIAADTWRAGTTAVPNNKTLEVQIRRVMTKGTRMEWSAIAEVST